MQAKAPLDGPAGLLLRAQGLGFFVFCLGFRSLGFGVEGLGFVVHGLKVYCVSFLGFRGFSL